MNVERILYSTKFVKEFRELPAEMRERAIEKERIFRQNPLHPSLRLHGLNGALKGIWSISVSGGYRMLFERQKNGEILFISVGKHDIYKYL